MFDENTRNGIEDLAPIGEELMDDELLLAAGGMRQTTIEIRSYDDSGKPTDLEIYIVNG